MSTTEIKQAWHTLDKKLIRNERVTDQNLRNAYRTVNSIGLFGVYREKILLHYNRKLLQDIIPVFVLPFSQYSLDENAVQCLRNAVSNLNTNLQPFVSTFTLMDNVCECADALVERALSQLQAAVVLHLPNSNLPTQFWKDCLNEIGFYSRSQDLHKISTLSCLTETISTLSKLGIYDRVLKDALIVALHVKLREHIHAVAANVFDHSFIEEFKSFIEHNIRYFLKLAFEESIQESFLEAVNQQLNYILYFEFGQLRIEELFRIIVEYPESTPALEDLKTSISEVDQRGFLITSLKNSMRRRLLHPGANTTDILTQYINSLRALSLLDGYLIGPICQPLRRYLRGRDDTVRCIMASLTDEGDGSELSHELHVQHPLSLDSSYVSDDDDDWENWNPLPRDADPDGRRGLDVISTLVNIYGGKELFVKEYRTILADRLLSNYSFDTAKEIRYLELLKLRFGGEQQMNLCEIMLKDIGNSRRINELINSEWSDTYPKPNFPIQAMILSSQYWPPFKEDKLKVSKEIEEVLSNYRSLYESSKGMRTIEWLPNLGVVDVEISLEGGRKESLSLTTTQASALLYMEKKPRCSVEELANELNVSMSSIRRRLGVLLASGLIHEVEQGILEVCEEGPSMASNCQEQESFVEEAQPEIHNDGEQERYLQYVKAMLTNLNALGIDRIYSMIKMFSDPTTGTLISQAELEKLLKSKVADGILVYSGGMYKLPNK